MNEITLNSIGNNIHSFRIEAGYSQEQLATLSGVERSQISKIEKGLVNGVTFKTISKILNSLGVKIVSIKDEKQYDLHPFIKWAGGKTQLLNAILEKLPTNFNRYFEPFVGGGALLFKLQPKTFFINDTNEELICVYKCFQSKELLEELEKELEIHEANHNEEYYYKIREMDKLNNFKDLPIYIRAARMIYLNKACFNGLYRVNSKGYFNVPFGKKDKINCFDENNFDNLFKFFKNSNQNIKNNDFENAVIEAKKGDFVYFDPPYDVLEEKQTFTSYDKNNFNKDDQIRLFKVFKELSDKGVYVMLSNHNTKFINELYKDYNIAVVQAKRMINSNAKGRGVVEEVLITNYEK